MGRLIACPGSFHASQAVRDAGQGDGGASIFAATGTVAHALAERAMMAGRAGNWLAAQVGRVIDQEGYAVPITAGMVEAVKLYLDELGERIAHADAVWWLEERVCLDDYWPMHEAPPVSAFGTADAIIYRASKRKLDIVDYKNGAGVFVSVIDSPQLLYYAAGALLKLDRDRRLSVVDIDLTIVQPNVPGQEKVRTYTTTAVDVLMWIDRVLKPTIKTALAPNAPLSPGRHCQFCMAKKTCPARAEEAQAQARADFADPVLSPDTDSDSYLDLL